LIRYQEIRSKYLNHIPNNLADLLLQLTGIESWLPQDKFSRLPILTDAAQIDNQSKGEFLRLEKPDLAQILLKG
jgi:hypothetical protein